MFGLSKWIALISINSPAVKSSNNITLALDTKIFQTCPTTISAGTYVQPAY
jgi:hypothetical protein